MEIADIVPESVVDVFEKIGINDDNREHSVRAPQLLVIDLKIILKVPAVAESRQRVGPRRCAPAS